MNQFKTYVLVHGAWHGGWCWKHVASALRRVGHEVFTPTLTGLGERAHLLSKDTDLEVFVTDIVNVLECENLTDIIMVGHSFGGVVISAVADRMPERIQRLVYLDALILQNGESALSVIPDEKAVAQRLLAQNTSSGVSVPVPAMRAFGVVDTDHITWLKAKCSPHPLASFESSLSLRNPIGNGLPTTYIAIKPYYGTTKTSREFAQTQTHWCYQEIEARHDIMITHPDRTTEILLDL